MNRFAIAFAVASTLIIASSARAGFDGPSELIYGLTRGGQTPGLVLFNSDDPGTTLSDIAITGLPSNQLLQSIDFRPATGQLFGIATQRAAASTNFINAIYVYTIDTTTGVATGVGSAPATLSSGIESGEVLSMDFNPAADRIRVVGSDGRNLRLNPDTGALVMEDSAINRVDATPMPTAVAYDKNTPGNAATRMFVWDFSDNSIGIVNPPNSGDFTAVSSLSSSFTSFVDVGMDFSSVTDIGYVSYFPSPIPTVSGVGAGFSLSNALGFFSPSDGNIVEMGRFPAGSIVVDIAVPIPEPTVLAVGLAGTALLLKRRREESKKQVARATARE